MTAVLIAFGAVYAIAGVTFYAIASAARRADNIGARAYTARLAQQRRNRIALLKRAGRQHHGHFATA